MDIKQFTEIVASSFENADSITAQTDYRNHDEWCSMVAVLIMSDVRKQCKVTLSADDLRSCVTVAELYELVTHRQ